MLRRYPTEARAPGAGTPVRLIFLGGVEEVGRNMMAVEYDDNIVVIDVGLQFPEENMPGIDFIVPNVDYLKQNKDKIRGVIITHGHYDHIGAIPYVIYDMGNPVIYTAPLTKGMILKRQEDFPHLPPLKIQEISGETKLNLGPFEIEFFHVNHNIYDAYGVAVRTPLGLIIHTGDFKFDNTPIGDKPADYAKMAMFSIEGILVLMADSTSADKAGHSISESKIKENLEEIFIHAKGRIIAASFASLISRIQQFITLAEEHNRYVAIDGRSLKANVAIAHELGYLKIKKGTLIDIKDINSYPDSKVLIMATGAQGEEKAVLMRIAQREHKYIELKAGDVVIFSSSVIPGSEAAVQALKDVIYRQGARVYHYQMMDVHAGGHAQAEDLKLLYNLTRPKFFVPISGNFFMLRINADLAESVGIPKENIIIPFNGEIIEAGKDFIRKSKEKVPANYIMVDGLGVGDVKEVVLRDRQVLAEDGIFVIIAVVDSATGKVRGSPDIISRGFVYLRESKELLYETRKLIRKIIEDSTTQMHPLNWAWVKDNLRERVGKFLFTKTERRPMVLPVIIEV